MWPRGVITQGADVIQGTCTCTTSLRCLLKATPPSQTRQQAFLGPWGLHSVVRLEQRAVFLLLDSKVI